VSDLGLRFGQAAEREQLEELQRRASLMHDAYREALLANPDLIALPRWQLEQNRVRVAERGGRALGFAAVLPRDGQICDLDALFVEPDRWKQGIGCALMEDAFVLARAAGAEVMEVLANPYADGFYARLGFVRIGTVITPLGIGGKMRRLLRQT
jgi:N-acetylglutamate synthase-like GNAT family acetyltransferase